MAPVFEAPGGPYPIPENAPDGTKIATVKATDADTSGKYLFVLN
jgi:hypothetical protein